MSNPNLDTASGRDPGALIAEVLSGVSRLVQGEVALAKAEATERLQTARRATVQVFAAMMLGFAATNVLAAALVVAAMALGLSLLWAAVVVGAVLLLLALGFAQHASRLIGDASAPPRRAAQSIRRDLETLQTMVKPDATA
jgi:Putative Actinobacterial Holin-X, holin superfamily III